VSLALTVSGLAKRGWVHLDIKPENVIAAPRVCLLDFGIACRQAEAARLDYVIGTLAYMAPEQRACGGSPPHRTVGPPADVYALAATLYEALTGARELQSAASLPPRLGPALLAGLEPDASGRPTATELAARLRSG
jgi:serine/threonine protein kinase